MTVVVGLSRVKTNKRTLWRLLCPVSSISASDALFSPFAITRSRTNFCVIFELCFFVLFCAIRILKWVPSVTIQWIVCWTCGTLCLIREQIFRWKHRSRVKFWQDFGVVGTPATDSAGSIRLYAHSTETRSSAPTPVMLRQREQREGNICSLAWGTSLVSLLLTL